MLGRNEYTMFSEADMYTIKRIIDDFTAITKKMGVNVTTDCSVSEDQETLMVTISVDGNTKCQRYTKSIALSWEGTVNNIKAGMFDILIEVSDRQLEKLWEELEDVPFIESDILTMVLASPWNGFDAGTDRESIWHWFDERHSKGVGWLLNEYKSAEEEGIK